MNVRPVQRPVVRALLAALLVASAPLTVPGAAAAAPTTPPASPTAPSAAAPDSAGTTGAVPPPSNATFGLQPVTNGRIDSRAAFTYQTGPGGSYTDSFAVANYAPSPVTLQVYAADLTNNAAGGLVVGSAQDAHEGAASWLRLPSGVEAVNLPAATTSPALQQIPFQWAVPSSAAAGDHYAAIVASLTTTSTSAQGQPVKLEQRVALRVFFRVSGTIAPALSVTNVQVTYHGGWDPTGSGTATVSYRLTNSGNVRLGAKQTVTTSAWIGAGGTPDALADQPLLLPGASVEVSTAVHNVFPGVRLDAEVHVDPVRAADDVNVSPRAVDVSASTWAIPWALLIAIVVVLALVGVAVWAWRRRVRRLPESRHASGRRRRGPSSDPVLGGGL